MVTNMFTKSKLLVFAKKRWIWYMSYIQRITMTFLTSYHFVFCFPLICLLIILVLLPLQISDSLITLDLVFFHDRSSNDEVFSLCTLGILFCELKGKHFASAFLHDLFCLLESHLLDFIQEMRQKIPCFPQLYGSADIGLTSDLNPVIQGHF